MTGPTWSSRTGFLFASAGFAVGLGNIWRFPYVAGENGGSVFVVIYLLCTVLIGIPVLIAEVALGRLGRASPPIALRRVARAESASPAWAGIGYMGLLAGFLIGAIYTPVIGWILRYLAETIVGGVSPLDAEGARLHFSEVKGSFGNMLGFTLLAMLLCGLIIRAGLQQGIERAMRLLMPMLICILVLLVIVNVFGDSFLTAASWLFKPDWSAISPSVFLAAIGQSFFSIGVAMAGMMMYGAYLPAGVPIASTVAAVVAIDTFVALLAGLVIFPVVFAAGMDPAAGPGLIFESLPVAFSTVRGGHLLSIMFFLALAIAAISSLLGFLEAATAWLCETTGWSRSRSVLLVLGVQLLLSTCSILSYNVLAGQALAGRDINEWINLLVDTLLLPLGGLAIAIFAGWVISTRTIQTELRMTSTAYFQVWRGLLRYLAAPAIGCIFLAGLLA